MFSTVPNYRTISNISLLAETPFVRLRKTVWSEGFATRFRIHWISHEFQIEFLDFNKYGFLDFCMDFWTFLKVDFWIVT